MAKFVLHDMLASTSAPMRELSTAHLVVAEVPPVGAARFEHDLLNYVHKLPALNALVRVVVQPSLRRKTNKALGVHKWAWCTSPLSSIRLAHARRAIVYQAVT